MALLASHFYLNLTHSHPRCYPPTPAHPASPMRVLAHLRNKVSRPQGAGRCSSPTAPRAQVPAEDRTAPVCPTQTLPGAPPPSQATPSCSTETEAAQQRDQDTRAARGPKVGTRACWRLYSGQRDPKAATPRGALGPLARCPSLCAARTGGSVSSASPRPSLPSTGR